MDAPVEVRNIEVDVSDLSLGDIEKLQLEGKGISMTEKLDILSRVVTNVDVRTLKLRQMNQLMDIIEEEVNKITNPLTEEESASEPESLPT